MILHGGTGNPESSELPDSRYAAAPVLYGCQKVQSGDQNLKGHYWPPFYEADPGEFLLPDSANLFLKSVHSGYNPDLCRTDPDCGRLYHRQFPSGEKWSDKPDRLPDTGFLRWPHSNQHLDFQTDSGLLR